MTVGSVIGGDAGAGVPIVRISGRDAEGIGGADAEHFG